MILMLLCKTGTGNLLLGIDVNHNLKSGWVYSAIWSSCIFYSFGIQLTAKWQFWRHTQSPFLLPFKIRFWAIYPCPWPNDNIFKRVSIYFYLAKESKYEIGSAPGLNTKIIGVVQDESLKEPFKSKTGDSINNFPKMCNTKCFINDTSFSSLRSLYIIIFWKISNFIYKF